MQDLKNLETNLPHEVKIFVHKYSIDYPRDMNSEVNALIHPERINKDWQLIKKGAPLFLDMNGRNILYEENESTYPVFIGEAAYREKKIAMSFTKKENIKCSKKWIEEFIN